MSNPSATTKKWDPVHPGDLLTGNCIEGFGITRNKLAVSIGVPPRRLDILRVRSRRSVECIGGLGDAQSPSAADRVRIATWAQGLEGRVLDAGCGRGTEADICTSSK